MDSSYFFDGCIVKPDPSEYVIDKEKSCENYLGYMLIRLQKMFKYTGLPKSIPAYMLEYYLLVNGTCFIKKHGDDLYALVGSFGGQPDAYYKPTSYVVANPGLDLSGSFDINTDGVLIRNDFMWKGLYPLMSRYAYLMSENILTMRTADIMLRALAMISAPDDKTRLAGEQYIKDLTDGKLSVIGENRFFDDGIKMQSPPSNNGSYLTQFIELHQYLKGSFFNEIGLNANFNMKREALGDGETSLNDDILMPLCDQMLICRQEDIAKVNEMFGTSITVEYDSAWATNVKELEIQLETMKKQASQLAESEQSNGESGVESSGDSEQSSGSSGQSDNDNDSSTESLNEHESDDNQSESVTDDDAEAGSSGEHDESGDGSDDDDRQASGDDDKSEDDAGVDKKEEDKKDD